MRWLTLLGLSVVILTACAAPGALPPAEPRVLPSQSASETPGPSPTSGSACDANDQAAAQSTIAGQQQAFATRDFARARSFSSKDFQQGTSIEGFKTVIEMSYRFLLDDPKLTYLDCASDNKVMEMAVEVQGDPSVLMRYRLVEEAGVWRIDVAGIVGELQDATV